MKLITLNIIYSDIFLHVFQLTTLHVPQAEIPSIRLSINDTLENIGDRILEGLNISGTFTLLHPHTDEEYKEYKKKFLKDMGFSSNKKYMSNCFEISVQKINDEFIFIPTNNDGKGFIHLTDMQVIIKTTQNFKIGEVFFQTLSKCRINGKIYSEWI